MRRRPIIAVVLLIALLATGLGSVRAGEMHLDPSSTAPLALTADGTACCADTDQVCCCEDPCDRATEDACCQDHDDHHCPTCACGPALSLLLVAPAGAPGAAPGITTDRLHLPAAATVPAAAGRGIDHVPRTA